MSSRALYILGTAALVPTRDRNHHGCFVRWDGEGFLFDPGDGTQRQLTRAGIAASRITKIFITHFHGDHCLGLPAVIQRISLDKVRHPVRIFYPASGQVYIDRLLNASVFYKQAEFELHPVTDAGVIFSKKNLIIEAHRLEHGIDTFGYRIAEPDSRTMDPERLAAVGIKGTAVRTLKEKGEVTVNGQTFRRENFSALKPGQSMAFIMDTKMCGATRTLACEVDLLVCEATFLAAESDHAERFCHLTAAQAATIARESGVKQLVLSHFSGRHPTTDMIIEEAGAIFKNVIAARDGDRIEIPRIARALQ